MHTYIHTYIYIYICRYRAYTRSYMMHLRAPTCCMLRSICCYTSCFRLPVSHAVRHLTHNVLHILWYVLHATVFGTHCPCTRCCCTLWYMVGNKAPSLVRCTGTAVAVVNADEHRDVMNHASIGQLWLHIEQLRTMAQYIVRRQPCMSTTVLFFDTSVICNKVS